jgi:hypothetical protein
MIDPASVVCEMSLQVWPSAFIRFAVAMCSESSTFRGGPDLVPLARDTARFRAVRSPNPARSRQGGVISKHLGPARTAPQPSELPRLESPISQCHRRVRIPACRRRVKTDPVSNSPVEKGSNFDRR